MNEPKIWLSYPVSRRHQTGCVISILLEGIDYPNHDELCQLNEILRVYEEAARKHEEEQRMNCYTLTKGHSALVAAQLDRVYRIASSSKSDT